MKTFPFLLLPAEIRDQIYGYLLSTKHTKHYPAEEDPVCQLLNPKVTAKAHSVF